MIQFEPGSTHTAKVVVKNPTNKAFDYNGVLYMGINQVAMAEVPFHLDAGESKEISFSVVMPAAEGEYPVYLSVFSAGQLLAHYQATESVVIVSPAPSAPFTFSNLSVQRVRCESATAWNTLDFGCTITNPTGGSITHTLTPMYRYGTKTGYSDPIARPEYAFGLTLGPGESYSYYLPGNQPGRCTMLLGFSAGVPYGGCAFLRDENGNDSPQACV